MMYENLVEDFAERTQKNLEFVDNAKQRGEDVYEVTQLINSLLGLLVFPREGFIKKIPATPLSELEKAGWPRIKTNPPYKSCENLRELVKLLRHSIAHFNIEFLATSGNIDGIKVWNTDPGSGKRTWEADLKIEELRAIAEKFIETLRAEK